MGEGSFIAKAEEEEEEEEEKPLRERRPD